MRKLIGTLVVVLFASAALGADDYPARAVRVVVPFAPGGGTDLVARILGQRLSQKLGQSFVIENRPAGSGIVGADLVAKAPADGYTLLFAFSSLSSSAKLFSHLPYDPIRDFAPVALATTSPLLAVVPASLPAKNVGEFVAYAKANPGKLNYGSSGPGSSPHLATELFLSMTDTRMTHIAYKGIAPAITALLADEVQFSLVPIAVGMPHVRSGKLRALGVAGLTRSSAAPELPTIAESGLPGFEVIGWWGVLAPAKTPRGAVDLLNRELRAALDAPDVRRTLLEQGMDPAPGTPEQFGALIKADMDKWGEIGRRLGVKLD
ncbi:MAG TPA: tripartite tricarboxylate transporter substrate binding protein [Burkholderiales bacterium]|jgi:tripartite-type tricarboxylate transporter receptor subunit TctC|nr:tripartite tricarboxylate transporter substrate binding protein [Burkholderiales bacterium]